MITFQAIIDSIRTLKDGSIRITIETPELDPSGMAQIFEYRNKQVFAGLNECPLKPEQLEIPEYVALEKDEKSPSVRLRGALYRLWEQGGKQGDANDHYRRQMEKFINIVKEKLN